MYECFHCGTRSVIWDADFSFEDYGLDEEGIKSDMDCAKVVYERGEYVKPGSCSNALSMAIKRYKYDSIVGVVTRANTVYLYKKENSDDRD